jgi:hypothetical protein
MDKKTSIGFRIVADIDLPKRYRQALETIEAAGGRISEYAMDLTRNQDRLGLSDSDIIARLVDHHKANDEQSNKE